MDASQLYVLFAIIVLAVVALLVFFTGRKKKDKGLSKLAAVAFAFVLAGIIFGEDRLIGYGLMGIGVLLAIIDIIIKSGKK